MHMDPELSEAIAMYGEGKYGYNLLLQLEETGFDPERKEEIFALLTQNNASFARLDAQLKHIRLTFNKSKEHGSLWTPPRHALRVRLDRAQRAAKEREDALVASRAERDVVPQLGTAAKLVLRELEIATAAQSGQDGVETDAYDTDAEAPTTPRPLVRRRNPKRARAA